jgi:hypothetical protein
VSRYLPHGPLTVLVVVLFNGSLGKLIHNCLEASLWPEPKDMETPNGPETRQF